MRLFTRLITLGILFGLKTAFNLDLTTLAVVSTALSVGIGFGLQFIAGDLASGFILLFGPPVRVGDFITITGPDSKITEGRVQSINLRNHHPAHGPTGIAGHRAQLEARQPESD